MTARKAAFGLCAICALLISAVAAQSASAFSQTAVKCTNTGTPIGANRFSDAHCKTVSNPSGAFFHVATPVATQTASELTNITTGTERAPGFLKATIGGLETILEAKKVSASGTVENNEAGGEMYAEGLTNTIVFEEVSVTNRTCEILGVPPAGGAHTLGKVETQPIRGTTKGQGEGIVKFEPQTGTKFAEFELTGASCPLALKGLYPVFGTVISNKTEGATTPIAHGTVTAEPAPKLRLKNATEGPVAGLEGKITIKQTEGEVPLALE